MPSPQFQDPDSRDHYDALESAFISWQRVQDGPASDPTLFDVDPPTDFAESVAACRRFIARGVTVQQTKPESQARSILTHYLSRPGWTKSPELVELLDGYVNSGLLRLNEKTYGFEHFHRRCNTPVYSSYPLEAVIDKANVELFEHLLRLGADADLKPSVDWSSEKFLGAAAYGSSEPPMKIRDTIWGLPTLREAGSALHAHLIANDMRRRIVEVRAAEGLNDRAPEQRRPGRMV
ncbi:hypothetical protein ABIC83_002505 [Roseateles asaccharophilus]|uniref:hypothetical protein n=1 Tax=Roseateles asaccharophilus TaxID=582607 RepID=UPI003836080E